MYSFFKKIKIIALRTIFVIVLGYGLIFALPVVGYAASSFNFGGMVLMNHYCTCSYNYWVYVGTPTPATLSFYMMQPQYANYMFPMTGVWTLGTYYPPGICLDVVSYYCVEEYYSMGSVNLVGTSQ